MQNTGHRAKRIGRLIAELGALDQQRALRAEGRLIRYGAVAVEALMAAAQSADPQRRFRAVWALGKIGDERATALIVSLTRDEDARVAYDAATVLGEWYGGLNVTGDAETVL